MLVADKLIRYMLNYLKNLNFAVKISAIVFIIIVAWVFTGIFKEPEVKNNVIAGQGKLVLLAEEIKMEEIAKVVSGYGRVDSGQIEVTSELNSHVQKIYKTEGATVKAGEPIIGLLSGVTVPSPISGKLDKIDVKIGGIVFAGQTRLFSVISNTKLDAVLNIPASDARFLTVGNKSEIRANEAIFLGEVYFISKVSDKLSNTFEVRMKITKNPSKAELFHDETVKISIDTIRKKGFFVPTSSISLTKDEKTILTVVDNEGIAKKVQIEVLQTKENGLWVAGNIGNAKVVIVRGGDLALEGEKVEYKLTKDL